MTEQLIRWEPISNLARKYILELFSFDEKNLILIFIECSLYGIDGDEASLQRVQVVFDQSKLCAYRDTSESNRMLTTYTLFDDYSEELHGKGPFFKIGNSFYIQWFLDRFEIPKNCSVDDLTHFFFYGDDSIFDIISIAEPIVAIISKS